MILHVNYIFINKTATTCFYKQNCCFFYTNTKYDETRNRMCFKSIQTVFFSCSMEKDFRWVSGKKSVCILFV